MADKRLELTTILNKRATKEYWRDHPDYVPGDGELILYKKDEDFPTRYKFGDGTTPVSDLPFSSDEAVELFVSRSISVATTAREEVNYGVIEEVTKVSESHTDGNIVAGEESSAGQRGFTLTNFQVNPGGNDDPAWGYFGLSSSADGVQPGDKVSIAYHISGGWTHSNSIDSFEVQRVEGNSVYLTSNTFINGPLKDGSLYYDEHGSLQFNSAEFYDSLMSSEHKGSRLYRAVWFTSHPELGDRNIGVSSVAIGKQNVARGSSSISLGAGNQSLGDYAATFNLKNVAKGTSAFASGDSTKATGDYSHTVGGYTVASGEYSFAGGKGAKAIGNESFAVGETTEARAFRSFTQGHLTKVYEDATNGAAFGVNSEAWATHSFAIGNATKAKGSQAFSSGDTTEAIGVSSFTTGNRTKAHNPQSAAFGYKSEAKNKNATAFGNLTTAEGENSTSFGSTTHATGANSLSSGNNSTASGAGAVAFNNGCLASGDYSFAAGWGTKAYGHRSATFGVNTETSLYRYGTNNTLSYHAMAIGNGTKARCDQAFAMGDSTEANHNSSVSEGYHTVTGAPYQHVFGKYNLLTDGYIVVGDGTASERKNIFELGHNKMKLSLNYDNGLEGRDHDTRKLDASFTSSGIQITTDNGGYYPLSNSSVNISSGLIEFHSTYDDLSAGVNNTLGVVIDPSMNSIYVCRDKSSTSKILDVGIADDGEYAYLPYNTTFGGFSPVVKTPYNGIMVGHNAVAIGDSSSAFGYQVVAVGNQSTALGYNTLSGITGFSIVGINGVEVELDSVDGLAIDDEVYVSLFDVSAGGWRPGVTPYKVAAFILDGRTGVYLDKVITKSDDSPLTFPDEAIPDSALSGRLSYRLYSKDKPYIGTSSVAGRGVAEGRQTFAAGDASHAEGRETTSSGDYSHAEGRETTSNGEATHSEGVSTTSGGDASHSEGWGTFASGKYSHSEGYGSAAIGDASHAEGSSGNYFMPGQATQNRATTARGMAAHAEGIATLANGVGAHAEGRGTTAKNYAHAEGGETTANGETSHSEGYGTTAQGNYSHAEGALTVANGSASHASGFETVADGDNQFVIGKHNVPNNTSAFIVGWGSNKSNRINVHEIDTLGNTYFKKSVVSSGITLCESPSFGVLSDSDTSLKVKISPIKTKNVQSGDTYSGFEMLGMRSDGYEYPLLRMKDLYSLMVGEGAYVMGQTGTATFTNHSSDGIHIDAYGNIYMNGRYFVDKDGNQQLLYWDEF